MIDSFSNENHFLSNFYPCKVDLDGFSYPSAEHAYQASKSLNLAVRKAFTWEGLTAADAKKLGREINIRPGWENKKDSVMFACLRSKFRFDPMSSMLMATGAEELVEGNNWGDTYWGVCRGSGMNKLGHLLMLVRSELNAQ